MTCARGCCWNPYGCSRSYSCACHWDERRPANATDTTGTHRDPTANTAIYNVMKGERR